MLDTHQNLRSNSSSASPEKVLHGKKNLKLLQVNYERNKGSDYTERIDTLGKTFDYKDHCEQYWLYPEFSLLYGSPLYEAASPSQKKALNHLYWLCFYNYSIGGEVTTMMLNQLTCGAFYHLGGYEILCHELDIETSQERVHVETFRKIGQATELALLGETIFDRPIPGYLDAALVHPQDGGRAFLNQLPTMMLTVSLSSSPFLASQYYAVRGLRNIQLKVKEYQHFQYSRELEKKGESIPTPTQVSAYHYLDEAFHTATSRLICHDLYQDFRKPTLLEKRFANRLLLETQHTVSTLSCAIPGIFSDDAAYMGLIYRLLQTPLFGLSDQEALRLLEKSLCQDHEGFHVAAKYHQRALSDNLKYLAGLEHLWPINRDLRIMGSASIKKTLKNNVVAFKRFSRSLKR